MATERRLIDANALSEKIGKMKNEITYNRGGYRYCNEDEKNEWDKLDSFDSLVCDAPTVDAVEVPCKIGDTVWCIQNNFGRPIAKQGVVSQIYFGEDMRLGFRVKGLCGGEWGQRVFATREEAEAAIGERRTDNGICKEG